MNVMQAQTYFCPSCYSDDHAWIDGEYVTVHAEICTLSIHSDTREEVAP